MYLSGPYLKSLLSYFNISASVCDANIGFYVWLLEQCSERVPWVQEPFDRRRYLYRNVKEAIRLLRQRPKDLSEYRWAVNVADEYLRAISPPGVKIGLTCLKVGNPYSSADLKAYLDRPDNMFRLYFEHATRDILGQASVNTYLISLVVVDQLPAAIAFSREIKRHRPDSRIIIGGPLVSRLHRQLAAVPWIANTFDAILPGEAYRVLPEALGLSGTFTGHVTPDFSDLDLDRYWSCKRVLPYLVAHGCNWGKCTFCSHHLTYDGYRSSSMAQVLDDLEYMANEHQAEYISFCDEYLTPTQLRELSAGLLERQIKLRWSTFARPESQFRDFNFMEQLYAAGCRMLMLGLESGSQRVINLMKKGTKVSNFRPILEACKAANIAVRYDFMAGFPGETEEEVEATYTFIRQNRDVIDTPFSSYAVAIFELRSGIPVLEETDRLGIVARRPLRGDLDDQYEFRCEGGLSEKARAEWRERLIRFFKTKMDAELICPQNKTHQLLLKDLYDRGVFDLPVLQVRPDEFMSAVVRLAHGVKLVPTVGAMRIVNHANGGELEVSFQLINVLQCFATGTCLDTAFLSQDIWNQELFARFITFLYRNEYIFVERSRIPAYTASSSQTGFALYT